MDIDKMKQAMQPHEPNFGNSAYAVAMRQQEFERTQQEINAQVKKRDEAIQRSAENSGKQVDLLEKQLQEVRAQNEMLQTQNKLLQDEFAANRADIEANAKANKHTRIFSIVTTVIIIAIALAGLIIAIA